MSTIRLTEKQWHNILEKLYVDVPLSSRIIQSSHKEYFGFTVRQHHETILVKPDDGELTLDLKTWNYRTYICLDFVDEPTATLFRLRWL